MPLGVVIVNRVLPELFTHADDDVFEALRAAGGRRGARRSTPVRVPTRCSTPRGSRCRCGAAAPSTSPSCATRSTCRCCYLPYLFVRDHGLRVTAHGRRRARPGARPVTARVASRANRWPRCCRTTRDRRLLRLGWRRQDVGRGRGRARAPRAASAARCSCSPSTPPSAWPTRSGSRRSATSSGGCRSTRTREPASSRAASCGPRCSTPSDRGTSSCCATRPTRRPRTASSTTGCTTTSPPLRAEPRLHRDGAALRGARERRVRPHHHRHAADAERDRLPRGAGAHGRLLRRAGCCAGSPCRTASAAAAARA